MNELLLARGLSKSYGGVRALAGLDLAVAAGRITALIGPNGAGKTTAIDCLSGRVAPDRGQTFLAGRETTGQPAHRLAARGLTRTFQNLQVFGQLSVLDNVLVGRHVRERGGFLAGLCGWPGSSAQERASRWAAREALELVDLASLAGVPAGRLSYGDRKRLELARALVGEPRLILLDEPVAGLNPAETDRMGEILLAVRARGVALVLVEHDMGLVMRVSDWVVVLHFGRKIAEGTCHDIQHHPRVIQVYLGGAGEELGAIA